MATRTHSDRLPPVFVLCTSRSGSTLLRFLLDAHPEIACPPETNISLALEQLMLTAGVLSADEDEISEDVRDKIANFALDLLASYAERHEKNLVCDKSLPNVDRAAMLRQFFPGAKFICLYRHCMDVVRSGLEAQPWGLASYGFEHFAPLHPGNSIGAISQYWVTQTSRMLEFEEANAEACHRIFYEELVTEPERVLEALWEFVGVANYPEVVETGLRARHDFGPADYKVWLTDRIEDDSVGSGVAIPMAMIAPPLLESVNSVLERLGYVKVGPDWNTSAPGLLLDRLNVGQHRRQPAAPLECLTFIREPQRVKQLVAEFARRGWNIGEIKFAALVGGSVGSVGIIDLETGSARFEETPDLTATYVVFGSAAEFRALRGGSTTFSVALRNNQIRYLERDQASQEGVHTRLELIARILGPPELPRD